jgi:TetR/AcrR family transcriptional regulator
MTELEKQTEEKIFEAASNVFIEEGSAGARMQTIADRAGINKALLHYYFRTKDHLFEAVFLKLAQKMLNKFSPIFEENLSLEEKIRFFFREHISFMQQNPKLPAFIISEINRNPERIRKLLANVDFKKFWSEIITQHSAELYKYNITEDNLPQIMTTIASLSVFPFAAKGIIEVIFSKIDVDFEKYIEDRKQFAADFVIKAISRQ